MCWLIRSVRASRWPALSAQQITVDIIQQASKDLIPRPEDSGGLSVYQVADAADARLTGILHVVLSRKPTTTHYLRIESAHIDRLSIEVKHEYASKQHHYLQLRHRNLYGITEAVASSLAEAILRDGADCFTLTEGVIKSEGRKILLNPEFASHVAFPDAYRTPARG